MGGAALVMRDAVIAAVACAAVGVGANAVRRDGLPLFAERPYETLVPCPEPLGEVAPVRGSDPRLADERTLVLDARAASDFEAWHRQGAWSVPFDYLDRVPDDAVRRVAASGASLVVVYGDGDDPDSGRELARELAGRGVRNVAYVDGGAKAMGLAASGGGGR